jgi:hypothetical protein
VRRPTGFIEPCQPSKVARPPTGAFWVHEIKHDGYRLMVRRDGLRVRCFTRNGHDWADRFPAIVEAAARLLGRCAVSARKTGADLGAPRPSWFCPNRKPDEGDHSHAENDNRNRGHFDDGKPS